jgi:predicted RNA-binding protein associated with RNAse of E/G family
MQLIGIDSDHLGYYVDVHTPMRKVGGEYYLTDLFLDLWIAPDGKFIELDQDEFEQGFQMGLLTSYQYKKANHVFEKLKREVTNGEFFLRIQ